MKVSTHIIPVSIVLLFGITFSGALFNTECGSTQGCERLESWKTITLIITILSACMFLVIIVNGLYDKDEIKQYGIFAQQSFTNVEVEK